jgi:hypothetical protein
MAEQDSAYAGITNKNDHEKENKMEQIQRCSLCGVTSKM